MSERVAERVGTKETRPRPVYCHALGCSRATRHGKPYCGKHVDRHGYVQEILSNLEHQREEQARVKRWGHRHVGVDGITAQDILLRIQFKGPRGVRRLARELALDPLVAEAYKQALVLAGLVELTPRRNEDHLVLTDSGRARLEPGYGLATARTSAELSPTASSDAGWKIAS